MHAYDIIQGIDVNVGAYFFCLKTQYFRIQYRAVKSYMCVGNEDEYQMSREMSPSGHEQARP